ncbi:MAG: phenylalanine--tRNA ligase subunit beta [Candidatus Woesearchaeota archaeon]|nr:MAG: phenylalanine--tRNA ligase subunit beta [Candidatus Woesearchaeota archaeon]
MPTIEINLKDLEKLLGKKLPRDTDKLNEVLQYAKAEVESTQNDAVSLNIEDSNRPDLWCVEGVARELKGALGIEKGLKKYQAKKSNFKVSVDKRLKNIRPFIACSILKGVKISDDIIIQLMQQQDKIDGTYGRKRRKTSIGLYNFDLLKFPLKYTVTKPNENAFVPLEFTRKLTPRQILSQHPKGRDYVHLIEDLKEYPIYLDAKKQVLSMPPIINSNDLGKIKPETKNIIIEVTGTDYDVVQDVLRIMTLSLADRGGTIYSVSIDYPYRKKDVTPKFETRKIKLDKKRVNEVLGINFSEKEIAKLLEKARYNVKGNMVEVPSYRVDIMDQVDLIEDVAIMYGYDKFKPLKLEVPTDGRLDKLTDFSDKIRELMIGFEAQEIMTFSLVSEDILTSKMNLKDKPVKVLNPISSNYTALRNSLIPSVLDFLSKNTTKRFPQKIFEVGQVIDKKESTRLVFCASHNVADFTEVRQILEALLRNIGLKCKIEDFEHESFTPGRVGNIIINKKEVGIIGEISHKVRENFGLEKRVVCFEIDLSEL